MIKLFASDLDGTLLNYDHLVDDKVNLAIQTVLDAGYTFSIATGRSMHLDEAKVMGFVDGIYQISMNGALIKDPQGNVVFYQTMDKDIVLELVEKYKNSRVEVAGIEKTYTTLDEPSFREDFMKRATWGLEHLSESYAQYIRNIVFNTTIDDLKNIEVLKMNLRLDGKDKEELLDYVKQHSDRIVDSYSSPTMDEITSIGIDKKVAVCKLAEYLGLNEDEVAVYGDNGNDLEMLQHFKHSYCPEDGIDLAKQAAHQVIDSCKDYGVSRHIIEAVNNQK